MSEPLLEYHDGRKLIVHVPSMLPDEDHPYWGIFMEAHIRSAIRLDPAQMVYYAYALPRALAKDLPPLEPRFRNSPICGTRYLEVRRRYAKRAGWQVRAMADFATWLGENHHRVRLLHAHGTVWAGVWCSIAAEKYGIPVLVSEHSSGFPRKTYPPLVRHFAKQFLPKVQALLPVTENLGTYLERYAPRVQQHVVANCVDTRLFVPTPAALPAEPYQILFVGSFVSVKRVDLLIRACAKLNEACPVRLSFAGTGPLQCQMEALARELGLPDSAVTFLGFLNSQDIQAQMAKAHVIALSSAWESQPCVLIEAMLSGRPVVAPRVGGVPEMVNEQNGCLFDVGDETQLVDALETVRRRIPEYDPTAIAEVCRSRHSYEAVGSQLMALYDQYALRDEPAYAAPAA